MADDKKNGNYEKPELNGLGVSDMENISGGFGEPCANGEMANWGQGRGKCLTGGAAPQSCSNGTGFPCAYGSGLC